MDRVQIEDLWRKQLPMIQNIRTLGAQSLFVRAPNIQQAFVSRTRSLTCIDGGVTHGLHLAGSGILLEARELDKLIRETGIKEFTTHDDCGAFARCHPDSKNPDTDAREWGEATARAWKLPHRHIAMAEMDRPRGFHDEICAYVDAVGAFNSVAGLPKGFVVSYKDFPAAALADTKLAISIALGEHGFGDRFTARWPFYIVPIARASGGSVTLAALQKQLRQMTKSFGNRVRISGVLVS